MKGLVVRFLRKITLPKTNIAPENRPKPKRKVVFQPSIFRGHVSFREGMHFFFLLIVIWVFLQFSIWKHKYHLERFKEFQRLTRKKIIRGSKVS